MASNFNPDSPRSKFTGIWIPAEVWNIATLSITEKALYGCIHSLGGFTEYGCYATNAFLAARFGVTQGGVMNMLTSLRKAGLVRHTVADGLGRQLWLAQPGLPNPAILPGASPSSYDEGTPHPRMSPPSSKDEGLGASHYKERIKKREEGDPRSARPSLQNAIVEAWNSKESLPRVVTVTAERARKMSARLKEEFFAANFKVAIDKVASSRFCNGANDRKWRATIDFFLRPGTVAKVMEGAYDDKPEAVRQAMTGSGMFKKW